MPVMAPSISFNSGCGTKRWVLAAHQAPRMPPAAANRPQDNSGRQRNAGEEWGDHAVGEEADGRKRQHVGDRGRDQHIDRQPVEGGEDRDEQKPAADAEGRRNHADAEPDQKQHGRAHGPAFAPVGDGEPAAALRHGFDADVRAAGRTAQRPAARRPRAAAANLPSNPCWLRKPRNAATQRCTPVTASARPTATVNGFGSASRVRRMNGPTKAPATPPTHTHSAKSQLVWRVR